MSIQIPVAAFRCEPDIDLVETGRNGFRMTTPPQGGGVHMDAGKLPVAVWQEYQYVTADIYHESHDVLVVLFTFKDETNRSITVHYGVLPWVSTKIYLPLIALNGEKLFLDRYPGVMQSVIRGDAFVDRNHITRFGISTISSVIPRTVMISGLSLTGSEPEFNYPHQPYVDVLGQLSQKDWEGKMSSSEAMECALLEELQLSSDAGAVLTEYSQYGGWKKLRFEASGFFRTEHDGERWWFVDPEGYALFSTGMDCIHPSEHMKISGMEHLIPPLPNKEGPFREAWSRVGYSFGTANLIRAFEEVWHEKWVQLTENRMKAWGINTIGNWSSPDFIRLSELPYVYPMADFPTTTETIFRDFPDVFSPEYERNAEIFAGQLISMRDDRRLVGYFMRNEPHWAFVDRLNLTELMLQSPIRFESKVHFVECLERKYKTVESLNTAWRSKYERFEDIYEKGLVEWKDQPACWQDCTDFNRVLIRRYVEVPAAACKRSAPDHLNMGMRYAWVASDDILEGCEAFDVFSLNCYQFEPDRELIERIGQRLGKPVMIGEFHFGAADVGMLAYGIRAVATQEDRGKAYRYFVERAASIPEVIGVHYFQLNDQPVLGRFDGENYQIGVVDGCQQPYLPFVEAMKRTHERMYAVRTGEIEPFDECPNEIPKTGF